MPEPGERGNKREGNQFEHPEMMGDETEEQSLGQRGRKGARITEEEVIGAFGHQEDDGDVEQLERTMSLSADFWKGFTVGVAATALAAFLLGRANTNYHWRS